MRLNSGMHVTATINNGKAIFQANQIGTGGIITIIYTYNANGADKVLLRPQIIILDLSTVLSPNQISINLPSQPNINGNIVKFLLTPTTVEDPIGNLIINIFSPFSSNSTFIINSLTSVPFNSSGGEGIFEKILEGELCNPVEKCIFGVTNTNNILFGNSGCDYSNLF